MNDEPMTQPTNYCIAVVHAYSDSVYHRSSFHVVGTADRVADVAIFVARRAIEWLSIENGVDHVQSNVTETVLPHPFLGLIDHIAVMPLVGLDVYPTHTVTDRPMDRREKQPNYHHEQISDPNRDSNDDHNVDYEPFTISGRTARAIGQSLSEEYSTNKKNPIQIFYYGSAHPQGLALAHIRKQHTSFFQSGSLRPSSLSSMTSLASHSGPVATIGAPWHFGENYNITLQPPCSGTMARTLARRIRERDGGLAFVEALTLPYSHNRWEVATNLLRPDVTDISAIKHVVDEWEKESLLLLSSAAVTGRLVERQYRVGTTAEQCWHVASLNESEHENHDQHVLEFFQKCLV